MQIFVYRSVGDANNAKCKVQNAKCKMNVSPLATYFNQFCICNLSFCIVRKHAKSHFGNFLKMGFNFLKGGNTEFRRCLFYEQ